MSSAITLSDWLAEAWNAPGEALRELPEFHGSLPPHFRLVRALAQHEEGAPECGAADFAVMLRAVCRYEARRLGEGVQVRVPKSICRSGVDVSSLLSNPPMLDAGLECDTGADGALLLSARRWHPVWLPGADAHAPDDAVYSQEARRQDQTVRADPVLFSRTRFESYTSGAQREAVRTVVCAPPGSTVVVNMPTGAGKSVCAFVVALEPKRSLDGRLGVTPIVVPTVALALDMEARMRQWVRHPVAYEPANLEEAAAIRDRCAAGTQGPVLLSPESLVGGLRETLERVAGVGGIEHLVVDEAHMVKAWGDEFRPAFQLIPSVRNKLLEATEGRLRTILMSATLTPGSVQTLEHLFGKPGPFHHANAVRLRPEPEYWIAKAPSWGARATWLREALHCMPRPLIVYTVQRRDAEKLANDFRSMGFSRLACMTGETPASDRDSILRQWNEDRLDVIVATSAFGLGVDKADVRAVIHAFLPENVDRFYQELGRGGRDGYASISLLIYQDLDWKVAGSLMPSFISIERGFQRWRSMFSSDLKAGVGSDGWRIPVSVQPGTSGPDIDMANEQNRLWNIRTLLLMARAGLIEFAPDATSTRGSLGGREDREFLSVRVIDERHLDQEVWRQKVTPCREELLSEARGSRKLLEAILRCNDCIAKSLKECYRAPSVPVNLSCAGCPTCRRLGIERGSADLTLRHAGDPLFEGTPAEKELKTFLDGNSTAIFWFNRKRDANDYEPALKELLSCSASLGLRRLVAASESGIARWATCHSRSEWGLLIDDTFSSGIASSHSTLVVLVPKLEALWSEVFRASNETSAQLLLVLPDDLRMPDRQDRLARDLLTAYPTQSLIAWYKERSL